MGTRNSSLTRVQPLFSWLYSSDPSGLSWLLPLLRLSTRSSSIPSGFNPGRLVEPPRFEFPAPPPRRFLQFLLQNPDALNVPPEAVWRTWSADTQAKRRALLANDSSIQSQGLLGLANAQSLNHRPWWRFEGTTSVDCALFTENAVIFFEGKRTEAGPSREVTWWSGRNQVIRNVECVLELARIKAIPHAFAMLIVEEDLCRPGSERARWIEEVTSTECIAKSLPHLEATERDRLMSHYLGSATWQSIARELKVASEVLLERV